jgi:hypothetical protein
VTAGAELAGTVEYATGWWVLAVGLVAAVLAWNLGVLWWGRPRRVAVTVTPRPDVRVLRERYLALIDQVEADHAAGRLEGREAHRRLSELSRGFVHEVTGRRTPAMTLADLRDQDLDRLVDVVEVAYPPAFGPDRPGAPDADQRLAVAADRARTAVRSTWT